MILIVDLFPAFYLTSESLKGPQRPGNWISISSPPISDCHKLTGWPGFLPAPLGAVGRGSLLESALSDELCLCSQSSGKFSPCYLVLIPPQLSGVLLRDFTCHSLCPQQISPCWASTSRFYLLFHGFGTTKTSSSIL